MTWTWRTVSRGTRVLFGKSSWRHEHFSDFSYPIRKQLKQSRSLEKPWRQLISTRTHHVAWWRPRENPGFWLKMASCSPTVPFPLNHYMLLSNSYNQVHITAGSECPREKKMVLNTLLTPPLMSSFWYHAILDLIWFCSWVLEFKVDFKEVTARY